MRQSTRPTRSRARRGAVAVEFAVIAPILLTIILGLLELNRAFETQNLLETAAREGARFAAMDRTDMLAEGVSANSKLIDDVKNFLATTGMPKSDIDVNIIDAETGADFDLDDPANDLRLFEVHIDVPFSSVSLTPGNVCNDYDLSASITFRNGRATLAQ